MRTSAEFAALDVAALNLICASGLPGAENLDIGRCLDTLDEWADYAHRFTDECYSKFLSDPADFENSQGYFCVLALVTALQRDLGVRYNPDRIRDPTFQDPHCIDPDFADSRDVFIHGIIDGPGGTCASMPVLCVAVGRRLGYPLKLVEAPGHLFARWDDPAGSFNRVPDRFNIECTGHGVGCHPDDRYRRWPRRWHQHEIDGGWYLKSLAPNEELASFLVNRGGCLEDNGRTDEALQAYCAARDLAPYDGRYQWLVAKTVQNRNLLEAHLAEADALNEAARIRAATQHNHGPSCRCWHCQHKQPPHNGHGPHPYHPSVQVPNFQPPSLPQRSSLQPEARRLN